MTPPIVVLPLPPMVSVAALVTMGPATVSSVVELLAMLVTSPRTMAHQGERTRAVHVAVDGGGERQI